ncbi:hypothetical protein QGN29_07840 [Temperatibacter marinus]|uniref:Secreted protein n=1 Tax=Temperatibacter marinus TaxID=1456591 RepID=A0AA52EFP4_9PROT|nr:hypothetical protein [Temperatibacter marinus]WND01469.1 hypothetical protein QGN29_07840 [Temperatibacter marinus]
MKKTLTAVVVALSLVMPAFSGASALDDKILSEQSIEQTEKDLMKACLEEKDNDPAECKCVLNGLKQELKGKDYKFLMTLMTFAIKDQGEVVGEMIMDKSILDLLLMAKRLEKAANKVENQCDGVTLKFDLDQSKFEKA